jgi:hormone-sensitive lipase
MKIINETLGDSAGANMLLSMTLWASDLNLPLPSGLFLAYVPLIVQFLPSPSRLLCLTDPLLPFGFMMRCLNGKTS